MKIPTEEQLKIIEYAGNTVVIARPGSGKTFTIVEKIKDLKNRLLDYQGFIAISYTKKASQELIQRCKKENVNITNSFIGTIDSFYIEQIIIPFSSHITGIIAKFEIYDNSDSFHRYKPLLETKIFTGDNENLLKEALSQGIIFLEITGEIAIYILEKINSCKDYLKARYTHIFIDEYQDCGEIQNQIFLKLVSYGIIGIAVGDIDQAIYAFSNRYSKYLTSLIEDKRFKSFPITKNHRCHESISNYSLQLMGIEDIPIVDDLRVTHVHMNGNEEKIVNYIDTFLQKIKEKYKILNNNDVAILCRGNAILKKIDQYLKTDHKTYTDNDLDKYNNLWARLFNGLLFFYFDENLYANDYIQDLANNDISERQIEKILNILLDIKKVNENDIIKCYSYFINIANIIYPNHQNQTVCDLLFEILNNKEEKLKDYKSAKNNEVNILTLHKSKGLEFKLVFHLELYDYVLPQNFDENDDDYKQSLNLHYVGITRAINACYLLTGTMRYRARDNDYIRTQNSKFLFRNNLINYRNNKVIN